METEHLAVRALRLVEEAGFRAALVGGWSRELLGREAPRHHSDIDLVVTDADVTLLDAWLSTRDEIKAKRFAHKRAFRLEGVMVELHLVRRVEDAGLVVRPSCADDAAARRRIRTSSPAVG
jgi:tRNA nucleotidyltransferase/poly(A) polymerase